MGKIHVNLPAKCWTTSSTRTFKMPVVNQKKRTARAEVVVFTAMDSWTIVKEGNDRIMDEKKKQTRLLRWEYSNRIKNWRHRKLQGNDILLIECHRIWIPHDLPRYLAYNSLAQPCQAEKYNGWEDCEKNGLRFLRLSNTTDSRMDTQYVRFLLFYLLAW